MRMSFFFDGILKSSCQTSFLFCNDSGDSLYRRNTHGPGADSTVFFFFFFPTATCRLGSLAQKQLCHFGAASPCSGVPEGTEGSGTGAVPEGSGAEDR